MKKNVIKVPAGYTDVENVDEAIDYLFDNDVDTVRIKYYYDENTNRMSVDDVFGYFGVKLRQFGYKGYCKGNSSILNCCEIVINLKEISTVLDIEQIASIIKYLSNNNANNIEYKFEA